MRSISQSVIPSNCLDQSLDSHSYQTKITLTACTNFSVMVLYQSRLVTDKLTTDTYSTNDNLPVIRPQPKYGSCGTSLNKSILNRIDSFPLAFIALSFNSRRTRDVFVLVSFQMMFVSSDCPAAPPLEELAVFAQRYWNGAG